MLSFVDLLELRGKNKKALMIYFDNKNVQLNYRIDCRRYYIEEIRCFLKMTLLVRFFTLSNQIELNFRTHSFEKFSFILFNNVFFNSIALIYLTLLVPSLTGMVLNTLH
jgi:hypothetical protein